MQHFWDRRATAAVAETFFLGWIDEQVLLVQGKEEHLEVLRQGWARRSLKPPSGFHIKCLEESQTVTEVGQARALPRSCLHSRQFRKSSSSPAASLSFQVSCRRDASRSDLPRAPSTFLRFPRAPDDQGPPFSVVK
nr:storkhead-box protein 1-like [Dromaius novaehollandiae]